MHVFFVFCGAFSKGPWGKCTFSSFSVELSVREHFSQHFILDLLVKKGIACQKLTLCNNFHQQEDRDLTVIKVNVCSCRTFLSPVSLH